MTTVGYIINSFVDQHVSLKKEVFDKYPNPFSLFCSPALLSIEKQLYFNDWAWGTWVYHPTFTVGELRSMVLSGRVDVQNSTMTYMNLSQIGDPETVLRAEELYKQVQCANDWIQLITKERPIAMVRPFMSTYAWQDIYLALWFKYIMTTGYGWDSWATAVNALPLGATKTIKFLSLVNAEVIPNPTTFWAYVDAALAHVAANNEVLVIISNGIAWDGTTPGIYDVNFCPDYYKKFMDKVATINDDGHMIRFRDLPFLG